jgi:hypothetical protein
VIVKLQTNLNNVNGEGGTTLLIYNQDRSVLQQFEVDQGIKDLMNGRIKAYFEARVIHDSIEILGPAPDQDW